MSTRLILQKMSIIHVLLSIANLAMSMSLNERQTKQHKPKSTTIIHLLDCLYFYCRMAQI